jgi:hypothetical protein
MPIYGPLVSDNCFVFIFQYYAYAKIMFRKDSVLDFRSIQKYSIVKNNPRHNLDNFTVQ